jgi:hypothetical protein
LRRIGAAFTATAFTVAGFGMTCATAGFVPALLFTETEFCCFPFVTATTAGLVKTPTTAVLFAVGTAFGPTVAGFVVSA